MAQTPDPDAPSDCSALVERALAYGPMAALEDLPRPGKQPTITAEAKAWVVNLACRKAKELGYPHELWTTRLLARHVREHAPAAGHICLAHLAQGTLCNIFVVFVSAMEGWGCWSENRKLEKHFREN